MTIGIYKIEDNGGKVYIGSSNNIEKRWSKHRKELEANKHTNPKLQRAYNKYGLSYFTFSIVEIIDDVSNLLHYEQIWLNILFQSLDRDDIYNILVIAGSPLGRKYTNETKAKISSVLKGNTRRAKTYILRSPSGELVKITNMAEFCSIHNLHAGNMSSVASGRLKAHKGWSI